MRFFGMRSAALAVQRIAMGAAFAALGGAAWAQGFGPGWDLDAQMSNIRFQSIKNETKVESSSFATFSGGIESDGAAQVKVLLDSVDTKIDLRNVRMRFLFFETFRYPEALVTAQINADDLADLEDVRRKTMTLPFSLDLHGIKKTLLAEVAVTLLTDDMVSVASAAPVSINVVEFGFAPNILKLEEAVGGISIVPSATVTFDFVFRRRAGDAPQIVARAATDVAPASVALETAGDFSREACEGRFEILSNTGNIYFNAGSARLSADSAPLLNSLAEIVDRCPDLRVEVGGHTDSDGAASNNLRLSEARARSVVQFLSRAGVGADRLEAVGYG